ncbi:hypothetical protein QQF64_003064 [Cirrhinus molitorella]|uniref:Uncharacterized protein n=1 Tax=Cirrhinus molitorella TaxID=172907 RepID=A0ABR3MIZ1_9TELE
MTTTEDKTTDLISTTEIPISTAEQTTTITYSTFETSTIESDKTKETNRVTKRIQHKIPFTQTTKLTTNIPTTVYNECQQQTTNRYSPLPLPQQKDKAQQ